MSELAAALNALRLGAAFDDLEEDAPEPTQILDPKQQQELMALRAQQSQKLSRLDKQIVVMFTDLVGSTQYYERYGDIKGREKVLTHNALLFPIVQANGGVIVKTIGDAIMGYYASADEALKAAAQMQQALAAHNRDVLEKDDEIHIRVALNAGVAIAAEGDIYGDVVNVAARIEHQAKADEVLMAQSVHERVKRPWPFESAGSSTFKGKTEPINLYRLRWKEIDSKDATPKLQHLPDRYEIRELLARGSIGELYLAEDRATKTVVVVKTLYEHFANDAQTKSAFLTAAREAKDLSIEGIVRVLDCPGDGMPGAYVVTDRVEGTSLGSIVSRKTPTASEAAAIAARVGRVLAAANAERVLHGNVDPDSVLVRSDGGVLLTNFAMAAVTTVQVRRGNSPPGTLAFIAPERLVGHPPSERSDVFTLGALLYYLLCGKEPIEDAASLEGTMVAISGGAVPLKRQKPDVPEELSAIVSKAMAMMPGVRHPNAAAISAELEAYLKAQKKDPGAARSYLMRGVQAVAQKASTQRAAPAKTSQSSPLPKPVATAPLPTTQPARLEPSIPEEDVDFSDAPPTRPVTLADMAVAPWRDWRTWVMVCAALVLGLVFGRALLSRSGSQEATLKTKDQKTLLAWIERSGGLRGANAIALVEKGRLTLDWSANGKSVLQRTPGTANLALALSVGQALSRGELRSIDDPVHEFFPAWRQGRKRYITLRHLLAETSGIAHDTLSKELEGADDAVQLALAAELNAEPGHVVRHNEKAMALLGGILEQRSGKRYEQLVEDRLLGPLGIVEVRWTRDKTGFSLPHSLELHPRDAATLLAAAVRASKAAIIGPAWLATLSEPIVANETVRRLGWVMLEDMPSSPRLLPSTALDDSVPSFAVYAPSADFVLVRVGRDGSEPARIVVAALLAGYDLLAVVEKGDANLPAPAPPPSTIQLPALAIEQGTKEAARAAGGAPAVSGQAQAAPAATGPRAPAATQPAATKP